MTRDELEREREALLAELHAAFKDVSRAGGVSWSESFVIDNYGSQAERDAARRTDIDTHWMQVAEDPHWKICGVGGFCFLDGIGHRYYLPAMIARVLRAEELRRRPEFKGDWSIPAAEDTLRSNVDHYRYFYRRLLDARQYQCITRFVNFKVAAEELEAAAMPAEQAVYYVDWRDAREAFERTDEPTP